MALPLRQITPKNARTKRFLAHKAPLATENPRTTLFLRYTTCSAPVQLAMADLYALKRPAAVKFSKKNSVHPFDDPASLEFFSAKNDASLMLYGSHSKKRPHCLTCVRLFDARVLDMIELMLDADALRTISQFRNKRRAAVGLKPLIAFSGTAFESPVPNAYTLAKSVLLDLFKGPDVAGVDVEGLQYMVHISAEEEGEGEGKAMIMLRCYLIRTKKGGGSVPKVEVEEMGPRMDFRIGRIREADPAMMKEALRRPKGHEAKTKKNIDTDIIGDKVGRIHMGKQDLAALQTRKMKGLKRSRDVADDEEAFAGAEDEVVHEATKRSKVHV